MAVFRVFTFLSVIYLVYLFSSGFGAGMEPIWLMVLLGSVLLSSKRIFRYMFGKRWFKGLVITVLVTVTFIEGMILGAGFQEPSEEGYDYMIVLGAGLLGDRISLTLKYRLDVAFDYLQDHPEVMVIVSGGQGPGENMTEAEAMTNYLMRRGIDKGRIIQEGQSTSTRENIAYSYALIEDLSDEVPDVLLVSSRFHLLRAIRIAKEAGHDVDGIGASTLLYLVPNYYFREMFAVAVEYLN